MPSAPDSSRQKPSSSDAATRKIARRYMGIAAGVVAVVAFGVAVWRIYFGAESDRTARFVSPAGVEPSGPSPGRPNEHYAGSASCRECHEPETKLWQPSQHANAARPFDPGKDSAAFNPPHTVRHGSKTSEIRKSADDHEIVTLGADGTVGAFVPASVIGIFPLVQYVIPFPGGRLQVTELAFDPVKKEWFDTYGDEDRRPEEWGFWTNRGMNWNSQCAYCHVSNLTKGYDATTDTYDTKWDEWGVSCEQCHGPMGVHGETHRVPPWPEPKTLSREQWMDVCGSCHARREHLTGTFRPGESFHDHFRVELPFTRGIYYADGQVLGEDFEYGSFLMSRMHFAGVTCLDCHDPHAAKPWVPVQGNGLCMTCHAAPTKKGAPLIDPVAHGHHAAGSEGNSCVGCHMPITVYMARDPRRDHGFTIPDPLLTREHGIPNACNRCHTQPGESVDWAVDWVEKWYGDRMERATRRRARLVARAHANDESVVPDLVAYAREEPIGAWRATLVALAGEWSPRPDAMNLLSDSLADGDPLVRAAAARALRPHSEAHQRLAPLLKDPVRLVRIDAAWALLDSLDRRSENYTELRSYLAEICDQPGGAHRMGQLALAEEQPRAAEQWMRKAVDWDRTSPGLRYDLGLLLNAVGKPGDAIEEMERARQLDPRAPLYPYSLGLLYAEAGNLEKTIERLEEAVRLDPTFARAWYNLGLAQAERDSLDQAVEALRKAEALDAANPEFPYARATVHMRKGEYGEARRAAEAALTIDPGSEAARALLEELPPSAPPPGS